MFNLLKFVGRLTIVVLAFFARLVVGNDKFVSYSYESVVYDLIQCIEATDNKLEKRLKRLQLVSAIFYRNGLIDFDLFMRATELINSKKMKGCIIEKGPVLRKVELLWENSQTVIEENGLFDEELYNPKSIFKSHVTGIYNSCGSVYLHSLYLSQIAFAIFVFIRYFESEYEKMLIENSILHFKGGVSVGRTLLTLSITSDERDEIKDLFLGGDNDTSLVVLYKDDDINRFHYGVKKILTKYIIICEFVFGFFKFNWLTSECADRVYKSKIVINGDEFSYSRGEAQSFELVPYAQGLLRFNVSGLNFNSIYRSMVSLDFMYHKNRTTFFLGRLKFAITLRNKQNRGIISAEIFDCAAVSPLSYTIFKATYTPYAYNSFKDMWLFVFGKYKP